MNLRLDFSLYHHPKAVGDNPTEFPSIARIPDAMLRKVDPINSVLVAYLTTDFNQLDFPINTMMFMAAQYQIANKFEDKEEYKRMKIRFHAVLGKREEKIWSLAKIV